MGKIRSRLPKRTLAIVNLALVVASALAVTVFSATTPTRIKGCVDKSAWAVRIIALSRTCRSSELIRVWNKQGRRGPEGPGPEGPAGSIASVTIRTSASANNSVASRSVTIVCDLGETVLGGGAMVTNPGAMSL